jgi:hypothetical protein
VFGFGTPELHGDRGWRGGTFQYNQLIRNSFFSKELSGKKRGGGKMYQWNCLDFVQNRRRFSGQFKGPSSLLKSQKMVSAVRNKEREHMF